MAGNQNKSLAAGLLFLNFCMYVIVAAIGGWAINFAIDQGFAIGMNHHHHHHHHIFNFINYIIPAILVEVY